MREIIFRGFHEDSDGKCILVFNGCTIKGFWVTGCLVDIPCEDYDVCISPIITDEQGRTHSAPYWENKNVIPETIGQFTGLCDKNGKKIFEGDRIIAHEEDGDCQYSIRYKADQDYPAFDCDPYIDCDSNGLSYLFGAGISIEVIGTIFDVKEEAK